MKLEMSYTLCQSPCSPKEETTIQTNSNIEFFPYNIAGNIINISTEIYTYVMRTGVRRTASRKKKKNYTIFFSYGSGDFLSQSSSYSFLSHSLKWLLHVLALTLRLLRITITVLQATHFTNILCVLAPVLERNNL